jgi:hypothetical protein
MPAFLELAGSHRLQPGYAGGMSLTKPMPMQLTFCCKVLVNDRSRTHGQAP